MVVRQVLLGVSGGAVLALFALFLANPSLLVEEGALDWVSRTWRGTVQEVAPEAAAHDVDAEASLLEEAVATNTDAAVLVAGLGAVGHSNGDVTLADSAPQQRPPLAAPSADQLDADSYLGALSKQTIIRSRPHPEASIVGFARTGA